MKPLISVLIPAYNVAKYVEMAISSVVNQTYRNLEILVINDGSTDETGKILEKLAQQDNRIRIITNEENLGLIKSLNKGLLLANGEYIARMDADDLVEKNWIETIFDFLRNNPEIAVCGANLRTFADPHDEHRLLKFQLINHVIQYATEHKDICKNLLFGTSMAHPSVVMKKSLFSDYGLRYDESYPYAEDYKLWFEISKIGKLANVPDVLLHYRIHPAQTSTAKLEAQRNIAKKIRREAINYYFEQNHIPFRLPESPPSYDEVTKFSDWITHNINTLNDTALIRDLCHELYLSLASYCLHDLWHFIRHCWKNVFSTKQRIKIIKKFIRTKKYSNHFYSDTP